MHGGRAGAPSGQRHGNYRHGWYGAAMQVRLARARRCARTLRAVLKQAKLLLAQRRGKAVVVVSRGADLAIPGASPVGGAAAAMPEACPPASPGAV